MKFSIGLIVGLVVGLVLGVMLTYNFTTDYMKQAHDAARCAGALNQGLTVAWIDSMGALIAQNKLFYSLPEDHSFESDSAVLIVDSDNRKISISVPD